MNGSKRTIWDNTNLYLKICYKANVSPYAFSTSKYHLFSPCSVPVYLKNMNRDKRTMPINTNFHLKIFLLLKAMISSRIHLIHPNFTCFHLVMYLYTLTQVRHSKAPCFSVSCCLVTACPAYIIYAIYFNRDAVCLFDAL